MLIPTQGPLLRQWQGGGVATLELASTTTSLCFVNVLQLDEVTIIVQPVFTEVDAGLPRSPLSYVLASTGESSLLTGSFYSLDGRELSDASGQTQYVMTITNTPITLGNAFLERADPASPNRIWADCAYFLGTVFGSPLSVMPGSASANTVVATFPTTVTVRPGVLMFGGQHLVWQPSSVGTFYNPPTQAPPTTTITAGSSLSTTIDFSSCANGVVFVRFIQSATPRGIHISVARKVSVLGGSTYVASVLNFDETFSPTNSEEFVVPIELDAGVFEITISVPSGGATATGVTILNATFS